MFKYINYTLEKKDNDFECFALIAILVIGSLGWFFLGMHFLFTMKFLWLAVWSTPIWLFLYNSIARYTKRK
jgi:hypothetical protein